MKRSHEKYEEERYLNINYRIYDKVYALKDIMYIPECKTGFFRTKKDLEKRGRTLKMKNYCLMIDTGLHSCVFRNFSSSESFGKFCYTHLYKVDRGNAQKIIL